MTSTQLSPKNSVRGELVRKMIHYSSSLVPLGYYFIEKSIVIIVLSCLLSAMISVEILKYKSEKVYNLYVRYFGAMLRSHEYKKDIFRLNGASWVIISFLVCVIIFPKLIAITAMFMLSFADSTSGLVGKLFGKKKYAPNRTYMGTIVFFLAGALVVIFTPKYYYSFSEYLIAFISLMFTTIADSVNLPLDDNFTIPVTFSVVLYLLYLQFYPGLNFQM